MQHRILIAIVTAAVLLSGTLVFAAATNEVSTELSVIVMKINNKLKAGQDTEKDLAEDLKEFDALYARHKGEKTDEVAQILVMKALLYLQVLGEPEKSTALLKQVQADFPGTQSAQSAAKMLASIKKQEEAEKINASLVAGAAFPDFKEKDLAGKPLSVAACKGKVVLIDFWATWCGPCVRELPNVLQTYKKYHADGFEIIGVSLDEDRQKLEDFIKAKGMTWPQFFDGEGWENKLAAKYGITSIPATFLLNGEGKIIGRDLRGEALGIAVAKALKKP